MGESIVETPIVKHKMGDSVVSRPTLEVSVSFGRFENDALSWEKWSSFSPNKYLEEVEKCSTPGSVAQKKAYFEAHYKKIAAKKLEQLEEETQQVEQKMEPLPPEVADSKARDETKNGTSDGDITSSNGGERFSLGEKQMPVVDLKNSDAADEPNEDVTVDAECDNLVVTKAKEPTISGTDESKDDISIDIECVSSLVTEAKEDTILGVYESKEDISVDVEYDNSSVTNLKEETILGTCYQGEFDKVEERNLDKGCQDSVVETPLADTEAQKTSLKKSKTANANVKNVHRKVHTAEGGASGGTKKKLTSPVAKSSRISTPTSKQTSTSKVITPSQPSEKKVTGVSTQRSNSTPVAQRKKLVPGSFVLPSQSSNKKLNGATPSQSSNKKLNGATPSQPSDKKLNGAMPSSNKKLNGAASSQSSNKSFNGAALQRSVNSPVLENKKVVPTSLHLSQCLSSPNSTASTNTMRKSLFMEEMGDKDIVKRAFKAFQNSFSQGRSAGDMTYDVQDQVTSKGSDQKISISSIQKESERLRKTPDRVITLKGQSGIRSTSSSSGASKDAGVEKKKVNSVRASTGSRINRSTDKWKEEVTKGTIKQAGSNR